MDLHTAAEEGNVKTIREILKVHPERVNERSELKDTPLHCAAYQKQYTVVQLLVEAGADIEAQGDHERTPLHSAAVAGDVKSARLLIQRGANLEAIDDRGQTPLLTAAHHVEVGRPETQQMVTLLIMSGATYDLESAVLQQDVKQVQHILTKKPDALTSLSNDKQVTMIHSALSDPLIMSLLLQHGGDPNAHLNKSVFSFPPLTRVSDPKVAEVLLENGADVNATNKEGKTRLQLA